MEKEEKNITHKKGDARSEKLFKLLSLIFYMVLCVLSAEDDATNFTVIIR